MTFPSGKKIIALAVAGLVSGAAFAQTSVTLSGIVDAGYNSGTDEWKGGPAGAGVKNTHKYTNFRGQEGKGMSSSRIMMSVSEDLGNGLKAGYYHEIGLIQNNGGQNDATATFSPTDGRQAAFGTTRQNFLFLESKSAGKVYLGYQELINDQQSGVGRVVATNFAGTGYNASFLFNPTASKTDLSAANTGKFINVAGTNQGIGAGDLGRSNSIRYDSPVFGGGFQAMGQFGYGKSSDESSTNGVDSKDTDPSYSIWNVGLKYANGPVAAFAGYQKFKAEYDALATDLVEGDASKLSVAGIPASNGEETRREWIVAGSYDFGVAKAFGQYYNRKGTADYDVLSTSRNALDKADTNVAGSSASTTAKYRGGDIGVKVPVGKTDLFASYGWAKATLEIDEVGTVADTATQDRSWKIRAYQVGAVYNLSKRTNVYGLYGQTKANGGSDDGDGKKSVFAVGMRHAF